MKRPSMAFVEVPGIEGLSYPDDCPFKTHRAALVRDRLRAFGSLGDPSHRLVSARPAIDVELLRFHTEAHLRELTRAAAGDLGVAGLAHGLGTPDTPVFPHLLAYGRAAVGAGLRAAELILADEVDIAFNLWGGLHHAHADKAGGFCYVNDVVLTCDRLAQAGLHVFCLDLDAHHGDGTQEAFYERADVFTVSLHESGHTLFPWGGFEDQTGKGPGLGCNANLSLPAGSYDEVWLRGLDEFALPLLDEWAPDVVVVELGMDTLAGDPLTHLALTNNVYPELAERLLARHRPLLILGGGGYHVDHTVRAWTLMWRALAGEPVDADLNAGLGGVFLDTPEWIGGLRDAPSPPPPERVRVVEDALERNLSEARQARAKALSGRAAACTAPTSGSR